jgi:hypothetical protein
MKKDLYPGLEMVVLFFFLVPLILAVATTFADESGGITSDVIVIGGSSDTVDEIVDCTVEERVILCSGPDETIAGDIIEDTDSAGAAEGSVLVAKPRPSEPISNTRTAPRRYSRRRGSDRSGSTVLYRSARDVSRESGTAGAPDPDPSDSRGNRPGPVPASVWHTRGNLNTDPEKNFVGTADETDLSFRTSNLERMRILSDGRVEIRSALLVEDYITSRKSPNEGGFLLADPQHGLKRVGNDNVRLFTTGGNILLEGGNVGIGTSWPGAKLDVVSGSSPQYALRVHGTGLNGLSVDRDGRVVIKSSLTGSDGNVSSYPLYIDAVDQGIAIRIDGEAHGDHNYVAFLDDYGIAGRIEGQNVADYVNDPLTIAWYVYMGLVDVAEGIAIGAAIIDPSGVVGLGAQVAYNHFYEGWTMAHLGVTYASGSGDYAEWLPRVDENEAIAAGDIVGVIGGRITKSTASAQQILPISMSPVVLGNMPAEGEEHLYEKVAFMGQVPVKVIGRVREGDYIIPSGREDGTGIAVSPEMMTAEEYCRVVGRAWSSSDSEFVKYINVAIGLNPGDVAALVRKQQAELDALKAQVAEMNTLRATVVELQAAMARLAERTSPEVQKVDAGTMRGAPLTTAGLSAITR